MSYIMILHDIIGLIAHMGQNGPFGLFLSGLAQLLI